jgi:hypothetical protein
MDFVFETQHALMVALNDYLSNPAVAVKNWQPTIDAFYKTQGGEDVPEEPFRNPISREGQELARGVMGGGAARIRTSRASEESCEGRAQR